MTPNSAKFGVKLGVKITPQKGVILCLKFLLHFWSYNNSLKITVYSMNTYPLCYSPLYNSEIGDTQLLFVTEIAPKSPFLVAPRRRPLGFVCHAIMK